MAVAVAAMLNSHADERTICCLLQILYRWQPVRKSLIKDWLQILYGVVWVNYGSADHAHIMQGHLFIMHESALGD